MRIALAQLNPTVGDVSGNARLLIEAVARARDGGAQVVATPELAIPGYPPEDLLLKASFVTAQREALDEVAGSTDEMVAVVGFVDAGGGCLYNAAAICHQGRVAAVYRKHRLPNYGVFDELRYFRPGRGHVLIETHDGVFGVCVCEDVWSDRGPVVSQGDSGAQIVININASPYHKGKLEERAELLAARARRARCSIVYVNAVGAQDELVFDGGSIVVDPDGHIVARLPQFEEQIAIVDVPLGETGTSRHPSFRRLPIRLRDAHAPAPPHRKAPPLQGAAEIYRALEVGLSDYVHKNRFEKTVVGLSGGIDSSLTATIAVDALGPDAVLGVTMPSDFSTSHSVTDAKELSANLGIEMREVPIAPAYTAYLNMMEQAFGSAETGIAEENIQARIRGNILMAISNRYGHLVLATGNKSEMACGYATLYGDMAGGFAVLKDVLKTEVYALARWRNSKSPVIPDNVITKAPSAELRHNQKDSDNLPEYELLDPILEAYIEDDASVAELIEAGHDGEMVERVITLVDRAEYKRRQAPPGPKVTTRAFGRDRRLPITNRWREGDGPLPRRTIGDRGPT